MNESKKKYRRTSIQIRRADEQLFRDLQQFEGIWNFNLFVSEMLNKHGMKWVQKRKAELPE